MLWVNCANCAICAACAIDPNFCAICGIGAGHVVKFQVGVDHSGNVIWLDGPRLGAGHDLHHWKLHPAPLVDGKEKWLADKAYIANGALL